MNIAEILKDKPSGIQLYSPTFGELLYEGLMHNLDEYIFTHDNALNTYLFMSDGRFHKNGECVLFPSKEMRDWEKFSWKKGDVLISGEDLCVFKEFAHFSYLTFKGKFLKKKEKEPEKFQTCLGDTRNWVKADDTISKKYYQDLYKFLGNKYKLNKVELRLETILNISLSDFKDGDILFIESKYYKYTIILCKTHPDMVPNMNSCVWAYVSFRDGLICCDSVHIVEDIKDIIDIRYATEAQKNILLNGLKKFGNVWNPDKKIIEDIKLTEWIPKPFDKVLVRCNKADKWSIDFFSHIDKGHYICSGDSWFKYCLPYNEETKKLIGTTNEK